MADQKAQDTEKPLDQITALQEEVNNLKQQLASQKGDGDFKVGRLESEDIGLLACLYSNIHKY